MENLQKQITKKRKFVADGVFYAELNEFLQTMLGPDGYAGVEVRVTPIRTEIIIRATKTREILGEKGRRIRELTSLVQKRFRFKEKSVELFAEQVKNQSNCAMAQAESLKYKLLAGLPVRRAAHGVLNYVMRGGATGCEVIISGKLRAQRAKTMKFRDGYLISTGDPKTHYIQESTRNVFMKQGILGVKVKIMVQYDPEGIRGTSHQMPDKIIIHEPKFEPVPEITGYGGEQAEEEEIVEEPAKQEEQEYVPQKQEYQNWDNKPAQWQASGTGEKQKWADYNQEY